MPTIKFTFKSSGGAAIKKEVEDIASALKRVNDSSFDTDPFDRLGGAAQRARDKIAGLDEQAQNLARGTQILQQALTVATSAIAGGVQDFAAFDTAIRTAGVTSQSSAEELAVLREEVTRLGQVSSKTPEEVARTSIELTRAGFSAQETADALEGVVRASEATGTSLTTVGDVVAKTIRQFGLAASDSSQVADVLVQAANTANVSVTSLGESLKFAGVAGNAANQDLETTVAALSALGDVGLQGGIGGRNLTSAFSSLQQVSAATSTEIEGLKTASDSAIAAFEELSVNFRDSNGEIRDLFDILPELRQQLQGLNQADQDAVVQAIFGTQGSRAVFALLAKTDGELLTFRDSLRDAAGTAVESGEAINAGLGGSLALLDSAISVTSNAFIAQLAPAIQLGINGLTEIVNLFTKLPAPLQTVVAAVSALGFAYTALVVAINAQLIAQTKLLATQVKAAFVNANEVISLGLRTGKTLALAAAQEVLRVSTLNAASALKTALGASLAFAAVGASILLVAKTFDNITGAINEAEQSLQAYRDSTDELLKLNEELAKTEEERAEATEERVQANRQAIEDEISLVDRLVDVLLKVGEVIANVSTLGLADIEAPDTFNLLVNADSRAFEEVRSDVDSFITEIEQIPPADLQALDPRQIEVQLKRLDDLEALLAAQKPVTEEAAVAQRVYGEALERTRQTLLATSPTFERAEEDTEALTAVVEAQTEAIDRRNEALAQAAQDQFDLEQEDRDFAQDDANEQRQRAFQAELQASEEEFQAQQDQRRLELQNRQQALTEQFDDQQNQRQGEFNSSQRRDQQEFEDRLNRRRVELERELQDFRREREEDLQDFRERREEEISELQQEADLRVQLQLIDDPVERARVEAEERARIEDEAEEARIRARIEAQLGIDRQREQLEEEIRAGQRDLENELAERQRAIDAELRLGEEQFQRSQEAQRQAFEEGLQTQRQAFEQQLASEREVLEAQIQEQERQFQAEQLAREDQFALEQREIDRAYKLEQRDLERAFNEQQRREEIATAEEVKEILQSAGLALGESIRLGAASALAAAARFTPGDSIGGSIGDIPGLRVGGTANAGQLYQLHRDEYVIPNQDALVISQALSRRIDAKAGSLPDLLRAALSPRQVSVSPGGDRLSNIESMLGRIAKHLEKGVNRSVAVNNYRSVKGMGLRDVNAIARAIG